jgi:hypothetical protein
MLSPSGEQTGEPAKTVAAAVLLQHRYNTSLRPSFFSFQRLSFCLSFIIVILRKSHSYRAVYREKVDGVANCS